MLSENILILTYWSYRDALIQTYTLPYVKIIRKHLNAEKKIFLKTSEQGKYQLSEAEKQKEKKLLKNDGISWITQPYKRVSLFSLIDFVINFFELLILCRKENIGVIHVWCTPPSIVAYFLSVFTGAKVVIDSYEPHAESMVENGEWKKKSLKFKVLFHFEKLISRKAEIIISATKGMRTYALEKYNVSFSEFYVKPACVDLNLFSKEKIKKELLLRDLGLEDKLVCVYAGKFGGIYLGVEIFKFFKVASHFWGEKFKVLILSSHSKEELEDFCLKADFEKSKIVHLFVSHNQIPEYIGLGDFAVTPVKPVSSKKYCTPIKDGEYWALGLPIVIPENISDDSDIVESRNIGAVLMELTNEEYLIAVKKIDNLLKENSKTLFDRIRKVAEEFRSFDIAEKIYSKIYN